MSQELYKYMVVCNFMMVC